MIEVRFEGRLTSNRILCKRQLPSMISIDNKLNTKFEKRLVTKKLSFNFLNIQFANACHLTIVYFNATPIILFAGHNCLGTTSQYQIFQLTPVS